MRTSALRASGSVAHTPLLVGIHARPSRSSVALDQREIELALQLAPARAPRAPQLRRVIGLAEPTDHEHVVEAAVLVVDHVVVREDRAVTADDHARAAASRLEPAVDEIGDDDHHRRVERADDRIGIGALRERARLRHERQAGLRSRRAATAPRRPRCRASSRRRAEHRDHVDLLAIDRRVLDRIDRRAARRPSPGVRVAIRGAQPVVAGDRARPSCRRAGTARPTACGDRARAR